MRAEDMGEIVKKFKRNIKIIAIGAVALVLVASSVKIVPPGATGVVTVMGKVTGENLSEGPHLVVPFITTIKKINNRVVRTDVESESASKDLQTVQSLVSVNYKVQNDKSAELYKRVGMDYDTIIVKPAIQEVSKAVNAKFTAEELIAQRQSISDMMREQLEEKISEYGLIVEGFNILNFGFTEEFNRAIEAKQTAQQEALKAQQDLERVKVEAEQKVVQAEADAKAYALRNQEITDKTLMQQYIEKWDGKLPAVVSDGNNIFDVSQFANMQ